MFFKCVMVHWVFGMDAHGKQLGNQVGHIFFNQSQERHQTPDVMGRAVPQCLA